MVVIGIRCALITNGNGDDKNEARRPPRRAPSTGTSQQPRPSQSQTAKSQGRTRCRSRTRRRSSWRGRRRGHDVPGAKGAGRHVCVDGRRPGASVTWTVDEGGRVQAVASATASRQGRQDLADRQRQGPGRSLNMENFAHAPAGDWAKGWTYTYAYVDLNKGTNTIKISCEQGNQCEVNLDQVS